MYRRTAKKTFQLQRCQISFLLNTGSNKHRGPIDALWRSTVLGPYLIDLPAILEHLECLRGHVPCHCLSLLPNSTCLYHLSWPVSHVASLSLLLVITCRHYFDDVRDIRNIDTSRFSFPRKT